MRKKIFLVLLTILVTICTIGPAYAAPDSTSQQATIGLADDRAQGLSGEVKKTLSKIQGALENSQSATSGAGLSLTDTASKEQNTDSFKELILTQLRLYELLYRTGIAGQIQAPVTAKTLKSDTSLATLEDYLTTYNILNKFIDDQLKGLDQTKPLYAALSNARLDLSSITATTITTATPFKTAEGTPNIRSTIQAQLNAHTANALNKYMEYLNDGKTSSDTSILKSNGTVEQTKKTLTIINQWGATLPDIQGAGADISATSIGSVNASWVTALADLIKTIDTGGDATKADGQINTDPTQASSAIGRLGSSLFSVQRAAHADDYPDKPATGTTAWTIDDSLRRVKEYTGTDPGPAAKDTFLAMFASTAVYTPFVSKVGDKDYVEAYKALFNTEPTALRDDDSKITYPASNTGPLDILSTVQNLKKPLYFFTDTDTLGSSTLYGHSTLDVQGTSQLLTVNALMTAINDKTEIAAVTRQGVAQRDGDTWSFYNYSVNDQGKTTNDASAKAVSNAEKAAAGTGEPILNKVSADSDTNAGNTTTRVLFEMTFNKKKPGAPLVTGLIMSNIYQDTMLKGKLESRAGEVVYIDAIGNIVLNDGTVVLPAAANPIYWAQPVAFDNQSVNNALKMINPIQGMYVPDNHELWYYNPFTVAVMDTYPIIFQSGTAPSTVNNKKDKNKYLFSAKDSSETNFDVDIRKVKDSFDIDAFSRSTSVQLFNAFRLDGVSTAKSDIIKHLTQNISTPDEEDAADRGWWFRAYNNSPLQMGNLMTAQGDSIFPYLPQGQTDTVAAQSFSSGEQNYKSAIYIAKNMYAYIIGETGSSKDNVTAADGKSNGGSNLSTLREGFLFNNVTMPNLTGLVSGVEFDKSLQKTNLLVAGGNANYFERGMLGFSRWVIKTAGDTKNVLAISNSDEVSALRLLYLGFSNYGFYFLFIFLIMLLVIFIRENDFMATLLKGGTIGLMLFVTLFLIPVVIPAITGFITEPATRSLTSKALLQELEQTTKMNKVTTAGQSSMSVKLYNLSLPQAEEMASDKRGESSDFLVAKYAVNDSLGLFVRGTDLRLDLQSFWRSDPLVIGLKGTVDNPNNTPYDVVQIYHSDHSLSAYIKDNQSVKDEYKYNKELIDYYMPFNLLEDGLISTLNKYMVYYKPMQSVVKYPDGLVKTSYIISTYTRSLAFLSADPEVSSLISSSTDDSQLANLGISQLEADVVNQKFYPYGDILNLQPWVDAELDQIGANYANSIWGQSMIKAGYYAPDTGHLKRLKLANKVNREVYDMFIRLKELNGQVSDENLIKLISLYATFVWNNEISYWGHNAYPQTVSLNEISVEDLLSATVLMDSTRYLFYDADLVSNVYADHGFMGTAALDLAALALMLYSILVSWVLPVLVGVMVVYVTFRIMTNKSMMPALLLSSKLIGLLIGMNILLVVILITYDFYVSTGALYLMAFLLVVVDGLFIWLFKKVLFHKSNPVEDSWQRKHLRSMGLNDVYQQNNYYDGGRYGNYYEDNRGRDPYYEDNRGRDSYYEDRGRRNNHLEESTGALTSGGRRRNRYE